MIRSYEEQLSQDGFLLKETKGISMEPMLREGREQSFIKSIPAMGREPRKGDVVLFRRSTGDFVLHRIVGRKGQVFRIRGDNCMTRELVERKDILGILAGFYRGETYVDCSTDRAYRRYVRRRRLGFPFRKGVFSLKRWRRGLLRRICK